MSKFELAVYVREMVKPTVIGCMGEKEWPRWEVALRSAVLRDKFGGGGGKLMAAIESNPQGALVALAKCAQLGLSPDPQLDHFALVPFGREIQGMVMYRGWIHLALQSGEVEWVHADVVYKQEYNPAEPIQDPITGRVLHTMDPFGRDDFKDEDIVGAYAQAKLRRSDRIEAFFLSRGAINKRRNKSKAPNSPAWKEWFPQMCCAKAYQALFRSGRVPLTPQMHAALEDDEVLDPVKATVIETKPIPPASTPPPETVLPGRKTGSDVLYDALDKNPLPDDGERREMLINAILQETINRDLSESQVVELAQKVFGDATVSTTDELDCDQLDKLLSEITKDADEPRS